MTDAAKLWVSKVIQKAFIEVNEEGSEAAAAATAGIMMMRVALFTPQFNCDQPFLRTITPDWFRLLEGFLIQPKIKMWLIVFILNPLT